MWLATLAPATEGGMPTRMSIGVIRNPPPTPNIPEMKPTAIPSPNIRRILTGSSAIGR